MTSTKSHHPFLPKVLTALCFIFCMANTRALPPNMDLSSTVVLRTIPLGFGVSATAGYGYLWWGNPAEKGNFLYGYLKPQLKVQSSVTVNSIDARLDISPVSPLVLSIGSTQSSRLKDFSNVDCVAHACTGRLSRNYAQAAAIYGRGPAFLGGSVRATWDAVSDGSRAFYDEGPSLYSKAGGDRFTEWEAYFGYKVDEANTVGYFTNYTQVQGTGLTSLTRNAIYSYSVDQWSYGCGLGTYRSDIQAQASTFFINIKWTGQKSFGIL